MHFRYGKNNVFSKKTRIRPMTSVISRTFISSIDVTVILQYFKVDRINDKINMLASWFNTSTLLGHEMRKV